jgi:hypothetical protein
MICRPPNANGDIDIAATTRLHGTHCHRLKSVCPIYDTQNSSDDRHATVEPKSSNFATEAPSRAMPWFFSKEVCALLSRSVPAGLRGSLLTYDYPAR